MKAEGGVSNSYRDSMIDRICYEAFGATNPSRTDVVERYGFLVGGVFSKGTQGRADASRALRQQVGELIETHGPKVLSAPELERVRAASAHGKRGTSRAAPAVGARLRAASPKGKASLPVAKARLRSRPKTPERPRPLLTMVGRASFPSNITPLASPKRARHSRRSPIARRGRQAASAAGAAAGIPDPTQAPALAQNMAQMRGARRESRAAAVAYSAAASSAAAAVPIPSLTPPRSTTPRAGESPGWGRRVRRKASPTPVGSVAIVVAAAAAESLPASEASQVYTCSSDEYNNQHCAMLSTDNDISWSWILLGTISDSMLTLAFKHLIDRLIRIWQDRRAMLVVVDADGDDDCFTMRPEGFRQSDASCDAARGPVTCDASTQVYDWE